MTLHFTEKVIREFKKCNVFIVILTKDALNNQFVNQEWGYAKCLKELGQVQLLLHVIEKDSNGERIESKGFISKNMDFLDIEVDKQGDYNSKKMVDGIIDALEEKKDELIPILTEIQQKLKRCTTEVDKNIELKNELLKTRKEFIDRLSMKPSQFQKDYALQILQRGHLFPKLFVEKIEVYITKIKEINIWKELVRDWTICRGQEHKYNTSNFYDVLEKSDKIFEGIKLEIKKQCDIYFN